MKSADGICSNDDDAKRLISPLFKDVSHGYYHIYSIQEREFFGLRDFYSLVKMLYRICVENGASPTPDELKETIQRNFGGYFGDFKPALQFIKSFNPDFIENNLIPAKGNLKMICICIVVTVNYAFVPSTELILKSLAFSDNPTETRYLLLLTKNKIALRIIDEHRLLEDTNFSVIYGSRYVIIENDQTHTTSTIMVTFSLSVFHMIRSTRKFALTSIVSVSCYKPNPNEYS